VLPWIAAREVSLASSGWPSNRALAYSRLDAAARFDPLSDIPAETEGLIAARSGDDRRARKAFARAIGRNSVNWYSRLELATVEARLDHRAAALAQLRRASELNPREPLVGTVRSRIAAGKPVSQAFVDKFLARESLA
jgi:Flp pilus assembly protein TadD